MSAWRVGDVVRYRADKNWCREGMAIATQLPGMVALIDTFWYPSNDPMIRHMLGEAEEATADLLFNVADGTFRELPNGARYSWKDYRPEDRRVITAQHGLTRHLYVRVGSEPDLATRIQNARDDVAEAEEAVRSAESRLEGRRAWLADLESRVVAS